MKPLLQIEHQLSGGVFTCEILEHIPFDDFEEALIELHRVSKKNVIISVPYSCMYFSFNILLAIPFFKKSINFLARIPYFFVKIKFDKKNKEHYWEMGKRKYPKRRIKDIIKKHFNIRKDFNFTQNIINYFFILEKRKNIQQLNHPKPL